MLICSILAWASSGADTRRHHHEERPADAGHMCWITWWVLRPFLVDFTMTASATARLLRWRQYACLEGLQRRQLLQRASGQRFVPATGGICWHNRSTNCKNDTTPRYAPSWTNTPRVELHVADVSRLHPVRCRLCQGQAPDKGVWTAVS